MVLCFVSSTFAIVMWAKPLLDVTSFTDSLDVEDAFEILFVELLTDSRGSVLNPLLLLSASSSSSIDLTSSRRALASVL